MCYWNKAVRDSINKFTEIFHKTTPTNDNFIICYNMYINFHKTGYDIFQGGFPEVPYALRNNF